MTKLIGRNKEKTQLLKAFNSSNSEFVVVYGRRRVGKTFLIRETYNYTFTFQHAGIAGGSMREQLAAWNVSIARAKGDSTIPNNWLEAFTQLGKLIDQSPEGKKIIFIDEMPWLDTPKANFQQALEFFWNSWASLRRDVLLIVCGSATSWIINNVIHSHGGLHNRVTYEINLEPFTLLECEEMAQSIGLSLTRYQILETYMILGGIPYYWSLLDPSLTTDENIDNLFFLKNGRLRYEFSELYASLFTKPEKYVKIVTALSKKSMGLTRNEISQVCEEPNNGNLTRVLEELEQSRFIRRYNRFGTTGNNAIYQLIDNYTLFYFKFVEGKSNLGQHYWSSLSNSAVRNVWNGLSFERVCLDHTAQLKKSLGISGVLSNEYTWRSNSKEFENAQIDLVLDRRDKVIDLCEMKFWNDVFTIDKDYDTALRRKKNAFITQTKTRNSVRIILITTYGVTRNEYFNNVQQCLTINDLFC